MRFQSTWLRWYAECVPEFLDAAAEAGKEIAHPASVIEEMRGFDRIDTELQALVRAWGEDLRSIGTAFGRGIEQAQSRND